MVLCVIRIQLESELLAGSGNSDADKLLNALDIIAQLIKVNMKIMSLFIINNRCCCVLKSERRMKKRQESITKEKLDELRNLVRFKN